MGHHGKVMENGLPSEAVVSVARPGGFVYDLVDSRPVPARTQGDKLTWTAALGPCDGRVYLVSSRPIEGVRLRAPDEVQRGGSAKCVVEVVDAQGRPLDAVVPLEVSIRDAEGRLAEFSGFYGAADGKVEIVLDVASNDPPGVWQIAARELASGRTAIAYLRVLGPEPWPPTMP